jgi:hypothetical protein
MGRKSVGNVQGVDLMNNLPYKEQNRQGFVVSLRAHRFDADRARKLLAGVEALAREGRKTKDLRVLLDALAVLSHQGANVRELLTGA